MINLIQRGITTIQTQYINPLELRRALGLTFMNAIATVVALLMLLVRVIAPPPPGLGEATVDMLIPALAILAVVIIIQRIILIGRLRLASWAAVGAVVAGVALLRSSSLNGSTSVILLIPIILAGLLLNRREMAVAVSILIAGVLLSVFNQSRMMTPVMIIPAEETPQDVSVVLVTLALGVAALVLFNGTSERMAAIVMNNRQRIELLKNARLVSNADVDTLLVRMADLLMEKLLYSSAQVYLLDDEGHLNLYARTGMGTRHSVNPAVLVDDNAIAQAIRQKKRFLVTLQDTYEKRSHLLPASNYALELPLVVDNRVIGVLDIQSNQSVNPFFEDEVAVLELMAVELAHALVQSRERRDLRQALETGTTANERLEAQLVELRQQVERGQGTDWTDYLRERKQLAFGFDMTNPTLNLTPANDLPESLRQAMQRGEIVVTTGRFEQIVNIPIKRYNDVLGAMSFSVPQDRLVTDRQLEMAAAVANRLASALENARLVEQTRTQAERERKAGEISDLLLGQQEVSLLLDAAAQSFNEALGAVYTRIYLEPEAVASRSEEAL